MEEQVTYDQAKEAMMPFVDRTCMTFEECGKWLQENAYWLAHEIVSNGGCRWWKVSFVAGMDGLFPEVGVRVETSSVRLPDDDKLLDRGIWCEVHNCVVDERYDYGEPLTQDNMILEA